MNFLLEQLVDAPFRAAFERLLNLLAVPGLSDVLANSEHEWWIDRGHGLERIPEFAISSNDYNEVARFLVALGDRHLDLIAPVVDVSFGVRTLPVLEQLGVARLRVHAVLESELSEQTLLSIRVHPAKGYSLDALSDSGMFNTVQHRMLLNLISRRQNFVISGSGGSGKTTLLRAMLNESPTLRTVVVEDTAEILPVAGHVVGLQSRQANTEGAGAIELDVLARQALRMRPDRLVIGEVRGNEAKVLFHAMNTGHAGSASTIHANSSSQVAERLRVLAASAGLPDESFAEVSATAIQWVIHLARVDGVRTIQSIEEFRP